MGRRFRNVGSLGHEYIFIKRMFSRMGAPLGPTLACKVRKLERGKFAYVHWQHPTSPLPSVSLILLPICLLFFLFHLRDGAWINSA